MNTLTVWRFDAPEAAEQALPRLERLVRGGLASIDDAALVSWPRDRRKPSTRNVGTLRGPGRLWGGFWGVLLAVIFLTPIAGPTFGAAAGAFAGTLSDFGLDDRFVKRVRDDVTPGTSALFIVSTAASADRLAAELLGLAVEASRSALSPEQEQHFREALADEPEPLPG